jgi:hypothetical protein
VPTCAFAVNPGGNATFVVEDEPFQVVSQSSGGGGPLQYSWQLVNVPPSGGIITPPINSDTVTITVFAQQQLTIQLTVWVSGGAPQTCTATIIVGSGVPTACVTPQFVAAWPIGSSLPLALDGSCSSSPDNALLRFNWTLVGQPYPYTGGQLVGPLVADAVGFKCSVPGIYTVSVVVNSSTTSSIASAMATINCVIPLPPSSTGGSPQTQLTPSICVVDLPPLVLNNTPPVSPPTLSPPFSLPPDYLPAPLEPPSESPNAADSGLMTAFLVIASLVIGTALFVIIAMRYAGRNKNSQPPKPRSASVMYA